MFTIEAGKYEDFDGETIRNIKVALEFPTLDEARDYAVQHGLRSYHFCDIIGPNGEEYGVPAV